MSRCCWEVLQELARRRLGSWVLSSPLGAQVSPDKRHSWGTRLDVLWGICPQACGPWDWDM